MSQPIRSTRQSRVLVVGSTNTDFIMALPALPAEGETVTDGRFSQTFGGKGANQAVAAARAGAAVEFITCVGQDAFGQQMLDNFRAEAIEIGRAVEVSGVASGTALVMFDDQGRNYLAVAPGSNHRLTADHLAAAEDAFTQAAVLVLQMEVTGEANPQAIEFAQRHDVQVLLNYAPAIGDPDGLTRQADVLVVNEIEAAALLDGSPIDHADALPAAQVLQSRGPSWVVITLGDAGYVAAGPSGASLREPGWAVEAIDTTAAGDTFCGVLAAGLAEGIAVSEALRHANVAGALATTREGAQPSIPHRDQIAMRLTESDR